MREPMIYFLGSKGFYMNNGKETVLMGEPFECRYCEGQDILVSGPHSHTCSCGASATRGWYTSAQCETCYSALNPLDHEQTK